VQPLIASYLEKRRLLEARRYLRGRVLDLGCGNAGLIAFLKEGQHYYGIDSNARKIRKLEKKYPRYGFSVRNVDEDSLDLEEQFDTITMLALLEHLKNPRHVLEQCSHLLTRNGRIVMTTPTRSGGKVHNVCASLRLTYELATKEHRRFYSYNGVRALLPPELGIVEYKRFELGLNQLFVCAHWEQ